MFFKKKMGGIDWIIAGLGNPGSKYDGTRHNVGFEALDNAAARWGIQLTRAKFEAVCGTGTVAGRKVLLMKPQTYMNLSGASIAKAADYYGTLPQHLLVLCDDIALAPGILRIRTQGSAGGHNGLKSIITFMGEDFPRIRIGVGEKPQSDYDLAKWVLSRFSTLERKQIADRYADIASAVELILDNRPSDAMSTYNGVGNRR